MQITYCKSQNFPCGLIFSKLLLSLFLIKNIYIYIYFLFGGVVITAEAVKAQFN